MYNYRNTRKKAANYKRIYSKNPMVKTYYKVGIPSPYWEKQSFEFVDIKVVKEDNKGGRDVTFRKSKAKQKRTLEKLLTPASFNESYLVSISSAVTEEPAIAVGSRIAKEAVDKGFNVLFWNSANYLPYNYAQDYGKIPDVVVIYNVSSESSWAKIEKVRDLLYLFEDSLRIVCSTGMNPVDFCEKKLKMSPSLTIYVNNVIYNILKSY